MKYIPPSGNSLSKTLSTPKMTLTLGAVFLLISTGMTSINELLSNKHIEQNFDSSRLFTPRRDDFLSYIMYERSKHRFQVFFVLKLFKRSFNLDKQKIKFFDFYLVPISSTNYFVSCDIY